MTAPYKVGDVLLASGGAHQATILEERPGRRHRWRLDVGGWWTTPELDRDWVRKPDEGKSGVTGADMEAELDTEKRPDDAEREAGEGPKTDFPSPDPYQVGVALGIAAMALGVRLDRISYGTVVENGRTVFILALDGRHLLPSEVVEVEAAARAIGVT